MSAPGARWRGPLALGVILVAQVEMVQLDRIGEIGQAAEVGRALGDVDRSLARLVQHADDLRTDEAGASGHENAHRDTVADRWPQRSVEHGRSGLGCPRDGGRAPVLTAVGSIRGARPGVAAPRPPPVPGPGPAHRSGRSSPRHG